MRVAVAHEWLTNWTGSECVARELVTVGQASQLVASVVHRSFTAEYFPDVDVGSALDVPPPDGHLALVAFRRFYARRVGGDDDRSGSAAGQFALRGECCDGAV